MPHAELSVLGKAQTAWRTAVFKHLRYVHGHSWRTEVHEALW